jgi:hypothetical protein
MKITDMTLVQAPSKNWWWLRLPDGSLYRSKRTGKIVAMSKRGIIKLREQLAENNKNG